MESSEDDAGTATSASCRASAREKDVGLAEDVYATRNFQHESSEARASCGTPAMSEDNFDGDSVPSPSAKDTSTEAILDMIDDFIDGPGAPRRVPLLSSVAVERACSRIPAVAVNSQSVSRDNPQHNNELGNRNEQIVVPLCEPSSAPSTISERLNESVHVLPAEAVCKPHSEILICVNQSTTEESPQASSSVQADINENNSMQQQESSQNVEPELLAEVLVVAPPSSSVEPLQVVSDASESENLDRTVKCVTSSENRDSVTVELAESTSSECSVSESKTLSVEPTMSRSPLKRRLIRPAPSDRRPDSTVSSTADSQTTDIFTTEQTCSETVTKDVSSSSDAVSNVHGNTKPEEISIVSEISICKAETSTAPSRKIKLVRPKVTPVMIYTTKTETQSTSATFEKDQCQSTSSDDISTPSSADPSVNTSMFTPMKSEEHKSEQEQVCDGTIVEQQSIQMSGLAQDVLINTHNIPISETLEEKSHVETPEVPILNQTNNELSPVFSTVAPSVIQNFATEHLIADLRSEEGKVCDDSNNHENILEQEKKLPPIKLSVSAAIPSEISSKTDHLEAQCSNTNVKIPESCSVDDKSKLSHSLVEFLVSEDPPSSYDQDSKINEELEKVSDMVKNDNKKVPPIKLNLSNTEHNKTTESCNIKKSSIEDESTSHKSEDCVKQVPKLTIKLSNKYSEEAKSSVPKLTIKPLRPPPGVDNTDDCDITQQIPTVTKINIKPIPKPAENQYENIPKPLQPPVEQSTGEREIKQQIPSITKIHIKPILKPTEKEHIESTSKLVQTPEGQDTGDINQQIPCVTKINIKPILKPTEKENETITLESTTKQSTNEQEIKQQIPSVTKINIKPIPKPSEKANEGTLKPLRLTEEQNTDESDIKQQIPCVTKINIKPIPKPSEKGNEGTSKSLRPPAEQSTSDHEINPHIPSVTKINIKPIPKPPQKVNDSIPKLPETHQNDLASRNEQVPNITKLNIKPIVKPPEKVKEIHRKSSSSEISESEYSENDESTSTSDQASASDQGPLETVPKVTIKLGKPGTESEGKFYTEKNVPKLTIKNIQHSEKDDQDSKLKLVVSQSDDKPPEKIPKITIKAVTKCDSQPLSPKLTIKPLKPPENVNKVNEIPKLKISADTHSSCAEIKENPHVPKITIKPVTKTDGDGTAKTLKKSIVMCDSSEHIPVVTKLNIKPILKPTESGESSESFDEKVPVVSKLNIKPVVKPKDNEVDSSIEDVPKIIKLNIKPLKNPEEISSEEKDCDEMNADIKDCSIPVVTKINIKPIVKPVEDEALKDSENQSSETGNSSDDNVDHIPIVTKLNIKPIVKPSELEDPPKPVHNEQCIPVVTKLNIKPLVKPEDNLLPSSPKKESLRSPGSAGIPVVTKLNIKPIIKPEEQQNRTHEDNTEKSSKQPSLVMKINKNKVCDSITEKEHLCNNVAAKAHSPKILNSPKHIKRSAAVDSNVEVSSKLTSLHNTGIAKIVDCNLDSPSLLQTDSPTSLVNSSETKTILEKVHETTIVNEATSTKEQPLFKSENANKAVNEHFVQESSSAKSDPSPVVDNMLSKMNAFQINEVNEVKRAAEHYNTNYKKASVQNCTLLKKLLSSTKEEFDRSQDLKPSNCASQSEKSESTLSNCNDTIVPEERDLDLQKRLNPKVEKASDVKLSDSFKMRSIQDVHREANESVTKPLEISITDKIINQGSGQDSPRIILKINKTDHGASAKIITEDTHKPTDCSPSNESPVSESAVESVNDVPSPKKLLVNSRRKAATLDSPANLTMGKRLRSSRIVETPEKSPAVKRNANKRPSVSESTAPPQQKEGELSIIEAKRMKLEQFLSSNKSLTITPVVSNMKQTSPSKSATAFGQGGKVSHNHSLLSNENCSQKNGNSKLHNILSNLQAKQMQTLQMNDTSVSAKPAEITTEVECNTSTGSSDVIVEITRVENCHPEVQEMLINENSVCDLTGPDEVSQDPLEVESVKPPLEEVVEPAMLQTIDLTPTPRKRGRPRKLPLTESAKPITPAPLPVLALEERPQRSLRLMRDRPTILRKPRGGRGRGRGARRAVAPAEPKPEPEPEPEREPEPEPAPTPEPEPMAVVEVVEPIDPTSSRIKLPRMTEALDKSVAGSAASPDLKLFGTAAVVLESSVKADEFMKTPEATRPRSGRGSRGGRIRTPRNRGRGRGGGRGAMYMKETLGIYGRVCGPATTTVQLFEEETCMMDDNATPSKPSHLLDEDSQSSVKSSTNDSNKMKKSKFADLFDSNKVWTAADVKEYIWPTPETQNAEPQVMMIQEQVAMFLGVKSFKRRYPELKRRTVGGEEREYVLSKGVVSEALCDLGITAVDASEVLDIMLSDYPHKYEEYRSHQRQKQIASSSEEAVESKIEERPIKVEVKMEKVVEKPEPPKVDPEKTRQDMAAAAIASAAEWNARANAWRRPACVDLQSNTIHRRRAPPAPPPVRVRPPAGFYPHALLPGQYQHWYRTYTSEQLRYFPLNTVLAAPPAARSPPDSGSDSEGSWERCSSSDDSGPHVHEPKRKKLSRKRSIQQEKEREEARADSEPVDTCRVCKLRLEANRKYTHERFLVCANCNSKLHPVCVELPADTIRKCREYPWQCAECKSCGSCHAARDADKMLFCDLCDRGYHSYCVGLDHVPSGRWHCVECAICKSCGARDPNGLSPSTPGPSTPGPSTPGPSTPGPSTPGPSTSGLSTPGPSTPGSSTPGLSSGPGEWHHQTRRGPGGHKVYSHSLCTPCARAYRIGRYCPLCERSFIGPKGTMQLVICKLCDRQLHQECVRATVSQLRVLDYTCGECRRGGITSRAAAVRVAPRTIATLFMAKRRFNKYAHRQYLASRLQALQDEESADPPEPPPAAD